VYFRYDARQTVMVIANTGEKTLRPDWQRYQERVGGFSKARNVINQSVTQLSNLELQPGESFVFELQP
jgi:archaellum component FlaG (FlaF/FlaG flagellin family)